MALKNFSQFTPQTVLSATDFVVGYRSTDEIRTDLDSLTLAISGLLISKGFTPGGALGTIKRVNYRYTIDAGENLNAVSGADDYGLYLTYTSGQLDVYRNGSHLVDGQDFVANNGTQVVGLSTMSPGDVIDIVTLSAAGITLSLSGTGSVFTNHYRYTVPVGSVTNGGVNVSGPDDLGNTLQYASPNLNVYLNGSHLVYGLDYTALNGSSITLTDGLSTGDIVDVSVISAYDIGGMATLSTGVFKLRAGPGIILNPANGVGDVTITGNTFALTGGNIVIPVGSTRFFKDYQSAINSLSALSLDTTANVVISGDPEVFQTTQPIILDHPDGDRITIRGTSLDFNCVSNPVVSVSGGWTFTNRITGFSPLSATIRFSPSSPLPAVGDYVLIQSVSGRDAGILADGNSGKTDANNNLRFRYPGYPNYYIRYYSHYSSMGIQSFPFPLSGAKAIISVLSAGQTNHLVRTIAAISGENVISTNDLTSPAIIFAEAPNVGFRNLDFTTGNAPILTIGTPNSYRGTTFTQITATAASMSSTLGFTVDYPAILTFSDTGVATKDYLNPGDWIFAIGQCRQVVAVSSNNNCVIDRRFWSGNTTGRTATISNPVPFFIKTHYERYAGLHRVAAVNGNDVTIQCFKTYATEGYGTNVASLKPAFHPPMPLFGVESLANSTAFNFVSALDPLSWTYAYTNRGTVGGKILKTRINYLPASWDNSNMDGFSAFLLRNSSIANLRDLVLDGQGASALTLRNATSTSIQSLGVTGYFLYPMFATGSQILLFCSGFATPYSSPNGSINATLPDGQPTLLSQFFIDATCSGSVNFCSFRSLWYVALGNTTANSNLFMECANILYNTEGGVIRGLYVYAPGNGADSGSGTQLSLAGTRFTAGRLFKFKTYQDTYFANINGTVDNVHNYSQSRLSFACYYAEFLMYNCYSSGIYGLTVIDGNSADIQQNYFVGNELYGIYFYQTNRVSDVGYLAAWNNVLNDTAVYSGGNNVFFNNRTNGGIYNNNVIVYAASTNTFQKINTRNYNKFANTSNIAGGLTNNVFDTTNDNLIAVT